LRCIPDVLRELEGAGDERGLMLLGRVVEHALAVPLDTVVNAVVSDDVWSGILGAMEWAPLHLIAEERTRTDGARRWAGDAPREAGAGAGAAADPSLRPASTGGGSASANALSSATISERASRSRAHPLVSWLSAPLLPSGKTALRRPAMHMGPEAGAAYQRVPPPAIVGPRSAFGVAGALVPPPTQGIGRARPHFRQFMRRLRWRVGGGGLMNSEHK